VTDTVRPTTPRDRRFMNVLGGFIFWSRWLQVPLYLGLIVAQTIYVFHFMVELYHLTGCSLFAHCAADMREMATETYIMLAVLGLIDVVMIANLLVMVIVGGYETFVSRLYLEGHPDQPEWLSHVNASVLKVKLAMALIGISSIHLLKTFINVGEADMGGLTETGVLWQVVIHVTFLISAIAMAWTDRLMMSKPKAKPGYAATHD
jgi:uncharacterized protein (TIGR00645 family)